MMLQFSMSIEERLRHLVFDEKSRNSLEVLRSCSYP